MPLKNQTNSNNKHELSPEVYEQEVIQMLSLIEEYIKRKDYNILYRDVLPTLQGKARRSETDRQQVIDILWRAINQAHELEDLRALDILTEGLYRYHATQALAFLGEEKFLKLLEYAGINRGWAHYSWVTYNEERERRKHFYNKESFYVKQAHSAANDYAKSEDILAGRLYDIAWSLSRNYPYFGQEEMAKVSISQDRANFYAQKGEYLDALQETQENQRMLNKVHNQITELLNQSLQREKALMEQLTDDMRARLEMEEQYQLGLEEYKKGHREQAKIALNKVHQYYEVYGYHAIEDFKRGKELMAYLMGLSWREKNRDVAKYYWLATYQLEQKKMDYEFGNGEWINLSPESFGLPLTDPITMKYFNERRQDVVQEDAMIEGSLATGRGRYHFDENIPGAYDRLAFMLHIIDNKIALLSIEKEKKHWIEEKAALHKTLGDLHMIQNEYAEAYHEYHNAIDTLQPYYDEDKIIRNRVESVYKKEETKACSLMIEHWDAEATQSQEVCVEFEAMMNDISVIGKLDVSDTKSCPTQYARLMAARGLHAIGHNQLSNTIDSMSCSSLDVKYILRP